jgi:hypothetical protein
MTVPLTEELFRGALASRVEQGSRPVGVETFVQSSDGQQGVYRVPRVHRKCHCYQELAVICSRGSLLKRGLLRGNVVSLLPLSPT